MKVLEKHRQNFEERGIKIVTGSNNQSEPKGGCTDKKICENLLILLKT